MVTMTFHSILHETIDDGETREIPEAPDFFVDLNLDQIVDAITAGKDEYNLKPFYYAPLKNVASITYRHEVMRDLEDGGLLGDIRSFAKGMRSMREHLAQSQKAYYALQKQRWFLDAVEIYCAAVQELSRALAQRNLMSRGLASFRSFLAHYAACPEFTSLVAETTQLKADLAQVRYTLLIRGNSVKVRKYESEIDYSVQVEATFEKFKQGAVKDYSVKFSDRGEMNHVEARVLELVARLHPEVFSHLSSYCEAHSGYCDETVRAFDREIQFYVAYIDFMQTFTRSGLTFCYPVVSSASKDIHAQEAYDLALAVKLIGSGSQIICNDFYLQGAERIIVVSGPNQGGKTTFSRTFGQLHYLASLGLPVAGRDAKLFLPDRIFTHFEREEKGNNLRGKLQDEMIRIREVLAQATPNSVIIMNEIFSSTTLADAIFLGRRILERIIQLDLLCVCVTFIDELSTLSPTTVSMVSTVVPDNPAVRTFKVVRRPADGLSYALSIAEKYRLTYDHLKERVRR